MPFKYHVKEYRRLIDLLPDAPMNLQAAQNKLQEFVSRLLKIRKFCEYYNRLPDIEAAGIGAADASQDFLACLDNVKSFIEKQKAPGKSAVESLSKQIDTDLKIIAILKDGLKCEPRLLPDISLKRALEFGRNHFSCWHGFTFVHAFYFWSAGLQSADVTDYINIGISQRSEMVLLLKNLLKINDIVDFREAGIKSPLEMIRCCQFGMNGRKIKEYIEAGIRSIEEIFMCNQADLDPVKVLDYIEAGIRSPAEMIQCRDSGLDGSKIRACFAAGISSLDKMTTHIVPAMETKNGNLSLCNAMIESMDNPTCDQMGISPINAWGFNRNPQLAEKWNRAGFRPEEAIAYWKAGFEPSDVTGFRGQLVKACEVRQYLKIGIAAIDPTLRAGYINGPLEALESSGSSTVYKGMFSSFRGDRFLAVFKKEQSVIESHVSRFIRFAGVDAYHPRLAIRNIATYRINNLLCFSVIPRTELCFHDNRIGIALAYVNGANPRLCSVDFDNPGLRCELVKLQLLDHLCAQCDRYEGNYIIDADASGNIMVAGIDNDLSFGSNIHDPNHVQADNTNGTCGTKMPEIADRSIHDRFKALTADALERELAMLLTGEEIKACVDRHAMILDHLEGLKKKGRIIEPDQWGSALSAQCLSDPTTCYVGRDRSHGRLDG